MCSRRVRLYPVTLAAVLKFHSAPTVLAILVLPFCLSCSPTNQAEQSPAVTEQVQRAERALPVAQAENINARFIKRTPWIGAGRWLKVDTHTHTEFSDGRYPLLAIVEAAHQNGCDAVAITDHASRDLRAATPEYFAQVQFARDKFPELLVMAGLEWSIPPYGGAEHASLLVSQADESLLTEFKQRFDDFEREESGPDNAGPGLQWLESNLSSTAVIFLNHPARKRETLRSIYDDLARWHKMSPIVVGFSGAPGHQNGEPYGSYSRTFQLVDRWDPAVGEVGGVWDQLLGSGLDLWAARTPSDFHDEGQGDYWPGAFSETWVYASDKSIPAMLEAMQAGSFFANHGGIAREATLSVSHSDLDRPATAGETIEIASGPIDVAIRLVIPPQDLAGTPNAIDTVELIAVVGQASEVVATVKPIGGEMKLLTDFRVPDGGVVFRARGRRIIPDGPDLIFMTNPIRVITPNSSPPHNQP